MPPVLNATGRNPNFRRDLAAVDLFNGVTATTDGDNIDLVTLTVTNVTDPANERLIVDGKTVNLTNGNSQVTGSGYTVTVSLAGGTATVTITPPAGGMTGAQLQGLIDTLAYQNVSTTAPTVARQVTITQISDTGGDDVGLSLTSTASPIAINELVSADNAGAQGNSSSFLTQTQSLTNDSSVSHDGRFVTFYSAATNLVSNDANGHQDVFVRDRTADTTIRVTVGHDGSEANGLSQFSTISGDGNRVAFQSRAFNLVAGDISEGADDIYVRDIAAGTTEKVSVSTTGGDGGGSSSDAEISQAGSHVVFTSTGTNLVDGTSVGGVDNNGASDVFVRTLGSSGTTVRASLADNEAQGNGASTQGTISANGNLVAFTSAATNLLTGTDNNNANDIFLRNISAGTTIRVSVANSTGAQANGASHSASMSNDGNIIAFVSSATNLGGSDGNGTVEDVFIRNVTAGTTVRIQNPGTNAFALGLPSSAPSVSADGSKVVFQWGPGSTYVYDVATGVVTAASRSTSNVSTNGIGGAISGDGTTVVFESQNTNHTDGHTGSFADIFAATIDLNRAPNIIEGADNTFGNEDTSFFLRRGNNTLANLQVSDADAGQILTVQVWVERGTLSIDGSNGGAAVAGAGAALDLTGTVAQINAALFNLKYTPPLNFSGTVQLTITATDNGAVAASFTENGNPRLLHFLAVAAVNDDPTLAGLDSPVSFVQSATPAVIDSDVTFGDVEGNLNGGRLIISGLLAEDRIGINNEGTGAGQINVSGSNVRSGTTVIGTVAGGVGNNFTVTFNSNATPAIVERLIENVTYANVDSTPTPSRTLRLNLVDGAGGQIGFAGTELFQADDPLTGVPNVGGAAAPAFVDLDGDGDQDLAIGAGGPVRAFKNNGDRTFTEQSAPNPLNAIIVPGAKPAFHDFDNDGDLDALVGGSDGTLSYYRNDSGTFTSAPAPAPLAAFAGENNAAPVFADVDGDGDLDLLVGHSAYDSYSLGNSALVSYFRNDGGTFSQQTGGANPFGNVSLYGSDVSNPALVDLDGDGDLDLLLGINNPYGTEGPFGEIRAFRNPGSGGQFTAISGSGNPFDGQSFETNPHPAVGDIDNDGDLDILVGFSDGTINVYENNTPARGQALTINVAPANAAPTLDLDADNSNSAGTAYTAGYTEGADPVAITDTDVAIGDTDPADLVQSATITITDPVDGDALSVSGLPSGIDIDSSSTPTMLRLVGAASAADYQTALELVRYASSSLNPTVNGTDSSRIITTVVSDGISNSAPATTTVNITAVENPAVAVDDTATTDEATPVAIDVLSNDSDPDGPAPSVASVDGEAIAAGETVTLASGAKVTLGSDGKLTYDPNGAYDHLSGAGSGGTNTSAVNSFSYGLTGGGTGTVDVTVSGLAGNNDVIRGSSGPDTLRGGPGTQYLVGGASDDDMAGGTGDDTYYVDSSGDIVGEAPGEGRDRIAASVSYTLAPGTEIELLEVEHSTSTGAIDLTGNEFANAVTGNAGVNVLRGGGGDDVLAGLGGNDVLVGGSGNDVMDGGSGDDTLYVDDAGDVVIEATGGGNDRIAASVSFVLSPDAEVELIEVKDLTSTNPINLTGSNSANTIYGNFGSNLLDGAGGDDVLFGLDGNDYLIGGSGNDTLWGGTGDDTYYVSDAGDAVREWGGEGRDRVAASVSYTLTASSEIEVLEAITLSDTTAMDLTGNEFAQLIQGNAGVNVIDGKGGNDILAGDGGADSFAFTTALGSNNIDHIDDFDTAEDNILLGAADGQPFAGLGSGQLDASAFTTGSEATEASHRIIYNSATGALLYDADGAGGAAAVQFATMTPGLALTAAHFNVTGAPQPAAAQQSVGSTGFKAERYEEQDASHDRAATGPECAEDACLPCTDYFIG